MHSQVVHIIEHLVLYDGIFADGRQWNDVDDDNDE